MQFYRQTGKSKMCSSTELFNSQPYCDRIDRAIPVSITCPYKPLQRAALPNMHSLAGQKYITHSLDSTVTFFRPRSGEPSRRADSRVEQEMASSSSCLL